MFLSRHGKRLEQRPTLALLARARHGGAHLHAICAHIHEHEGAAGLRRTLGVLVLAKKHEPPGRR